MKTSSIPNRQPFHNTVIITLIIMTAVSFRTIAGPAASAGKNRQASDTSIRYTTDIRQITENKCSGHCHNPDHHVSYFHTLSLDSYENLKYAADSGLLNERLFIRCDMPPAGSQQLNAEELQKFRDWIAQGCPF